MQHSHYNESLDTFFRETGSVWEHWSQVHLTALETGSLLFICVSFLQKWNTQLMIPASSTNRNSLDEDREKSCVDLYRTNEPFPVEQLQTFSQLLQNIHHLEVSFRKVSVSSLNVLREQRIFLYALFICEQCVGYLVLTEYLVLPEGDERLLEMVLLLVK